MDDEGEGLDSGQDDSLEHRRWLEEHPFESPEAWSAWLDKARRLSAEFKEACAAFDAAVKQFEATINDNPRRNP